MSGSVEIGTWSGFFQVAQVVSRRTGIPLARRTDSATSPTTAGTSARIRAFVHCRPGRPRLGPGSAETHDVITLVRKVRVIARAHGARDARTQWSARPGRHTRNEARLFWCGYANEHDPQTFLRQIPPLLTQEKPEDRQAPQSRHVCFARGSAQARARGPGLQAALMRPHVRTGSRRRAPLTAPGRWLWNRAPLIFLKAWSAIPMELAAKGAEP